MVFQTPNLQLLLACFDNRHGQRYCDIEIEVPSETVGHDLTHFKPEGQKRLKRVKAKLLKLNHFHLNYSVD